MVYGVLQSARWRDERSTPSVRAVRGDDKVRPAEVVLGRPEKARLLILSMSERTAFLSLALPDAALRRICRGLGLSFPGYRLEKVPGADLVHALAEEYQTNPRAAVLTDASLDEVCSVPLPIPAGPIRPGVVRLMAFLAAAPPGAIVALLWQFFGHPVEKVRQAGVGALDDHLDFLDGMAADFPAGPEVGGRVRTGHSAGSQEGSRGEMRRRLKDAEGRAAVLGRELDAARAQLVGERRQVALRDERLAQSKVDLTETERRLRASEESRSALAARLDRDAETDARHHMAEAARLTHEMDALQAELARARRREAELLSRLKEARTSPAPVTAPPSVEPPPDPGTSFQVPVFSSEFYDSIHRWDVHIVRTAFEKVLLLSQNPAHPGLDAKPIESADGLYRIKIAQDVRLFYRRLPAGRLDILSLIDREDLERYIHRYRTRVRG